MNLNTIASLLSQPPQLNIEITGICIDSRLIKPGNLFIALVGDRFDGHDFIPEVVAKGAVAVVADRKIDGLNVVLMLVKDTLDALAKIAAMHRQTMTAPVIALTGSNGKTTVKEMIAAILPPPSHATKANLNNHIGAPLSVLQMNNHHRYAVFELGANHSGEIAHTVSIVRPDVALINNIAPAHVEGFGSIEGVARAKGEIYQGLPVNGTAIINEDDDYAHYWDDLLSDKKIMRFSALKPADIYAQDIRFDPQGRAGFSLILPNAQAYIELHVPGIHNVSNALAAASCCYAIGISIEDIQKGLANFTGVQGRMTVLNARNNATLIDDTYNANLRSVITGLKVLAARSGKKIFVFGDMGELGAWTTAHHQEVGLVARQLGIDALLCCGSDSLLTAQAFGSGAFHFSNQEDLVDKLTNMMDSSTTVLVKGSRSSAMEKIVHKLLN